MSNTSPIFVAGASRGVGREIVRLLREQATPVTALLRSDAAQDELEALGATVVFGDALNADEVEQAMLATPIEIVVTTVGGMPQDGQRVDYLGNKNLIDAAVAVGVKKFILVSSIGSGDSVVALSPQVLQTLGPVLAEKERAEQHLIASGLTYTIVRPGGLKSEPATGHGVLTLDPTVVGTIHRADVALLVCQCLLSDKSNNRVLSAVDRQMVYGQTEITEFKLTD
jgi:uncharacterized protein YbjT (DUF2867 family)